MSDRKNYRFVRWLQSPVGRALEHLLWRFPPWKRWTSRHVWAALERDPTFIASIERGMTDFAAGRSYRYSVDELRGGLPGAPSDTWQPDDPHQPDGWHHDGEKWVMNDSGWWQDPSGFWRYNAPGDIGWKEQPDGSWGYFYPDGKRRTPLD